MMLNKRDNRYLRLITGLSFWENSLETSIAETKIYNIINDFMLEQGNYPRKVLFLGLDGMRADALVNIVSDKSSFETNGYNFQAEYSGINELRKTGGLYLSYCGGEKGMQNQQQTSTSACWTSQFTGVWGDKHGITTNDDTKNMEFKTLMLEFAEKGLKTSFAFDWAQYLDINLKEEVKYAMAHPEINITYCVIDRKKEKNKPDGMYAESLNLHNFVAPEIPSAYAPYDIGMKFYLENRIESGDDMIFGVFHNIDSNGHAYGFSNNSYQYVNSVRNCDTYSYDLIKTVQRREIELGEEWLVIMANDHGGINRGHGKQSSEERTTWIASNRKIHTKYYSSGYNGFVLK